MVVVFREWKGILSILGVEGLVDGGSLPLYRGIRASVDNCPPSPIIAVAAPMTGDYHDSGSAAAVVAACETVCLATASYCLTLWLLAQMQVIALLF